MLYSLGKLLFLEMHRHINFVKVNRVPDFAGRKHRIDGGKDHPRNGDDSALLAAAFGNLLILFGIIRRLFVLQGCVCSLHKRRLEINSRT